MRKTMDYFNQDTLLKLERWVKSSDGYAEIEGFDFVILTKKKFEKICEALDLLNNYLHSEKYLHF